jgi:mRNA-degrading endonuclease toxin of MazEF toxin-antitoxin module
MPGHKPRRGDDFAGAGYVPELGHVVHMNWNPALGREMKGPHYALVVSATLFNQGTGFAVLCPITSKVGKLSAFEFAVAAGRVKGVAILSDLRSIDYQERSVQFEAEIAPTEVGEANRRIRMIFP